MSQLVRSSNCDSQCVSRDRRTHRYMHVLVSFVTYILLCIIIVALHVTTRPKSELWLSQFGLGSWLKVCEPWQTNTSRHAFRSVPENDKRRKKFYGFSSYVMLFVALAFWALYNLESSPQSYLATMIQRTAWDYCSMLEHTRAKRNCFFYVPCCCGGEI